MKIIAINTSGYPYGYSPMVSRLHYYMKALMHAGAEVEVIIPSLKETGKYIYDGVPYSYIKVTIKPNRFNYNQQVNEYAGLIEKLAIKCDVFFSSEDQNYPIIRIANAVHKTGAKFVIELNENPYCTHSSRFDTGLFDGYHRKKFFSNTLKNVDGVITISHALYNKVIKQNHKHLKVTRIPILAGNKDLSRSRDVSNPPYILHAGALSDQKDGVKAMLKAFNDAHKQLNSELKFIFTSKSTYPRLLRWIKNFVEDNNLSEAVEFKGIVSREELNQLYNNCALAIVNKPLNNQNAFNFPTKLTELLPREIPLIVSDTAELSYYFKEKENAYVIEPNNVKQMTEKIIYIVENYENAKEVARQGRILAEREFYYETRSEEFRLFFERTIKG